MDGFFELFDGPPESWPDKIVFTGGRSGPPRWHVRDQEARILALPPCPVAPADRTGLGPVALASYPAMLWLPDGATPAEYESDDGDGDGSDGRDDPAVAATHHVEGWNWSDEESLHLAIGTSPELPGRYSLSAYAPEDCRADLGGRPMRVRRFAAPDDAGQVRHQAVVDGYLDDTHDLYAQIHAETAERRDALLSSLLTLTTTTAPAGGTSREADAPGG